MNRYITGIFNEWRGWAVPAIVTAFLFLISRDNSLLFHTYAELFSITVAVIVAVVAWYTYVFSRNDFLMFLGAGYFWVGILDLLHTLTFNGLDIIANTDANTSMQFWTASRYLQAFLLLASPYFLIHRINKLLAVALFGVATILIYWMIMSGGFPDTYIEGQGLTPFKVNSEYIIIAMLLSAGAMMIYYRTLIDPGILKLIVTSVVLTALAELGFALYASVYGDVIFIGHILKIVAYWCIFVAMVRTTLAHPYQVMARGSSTYDAIPDAIIVVDRDGIIRQVNKAACTDVGKPAEDMLGQHCHYVFHPKNISIDHCPVCEHIRLGRKLNNFEMKFSDENVWRVFTLTPFETIGELTGIVHVSPDITSRKNAEEELINQANYDSLTRFPNRALATDRLERAIERSKREGLSTAVLFTDIDNFKKVNETLGHAVGDKLLIAVANRLSESVCQRDTVARWGGDEFLVIVPELNSLVEAEGIAEKILHSLERPVIVQGREFNTSMTIGISGFPNDGDSPDILLSNADAAMYQAKNAGKNTFRFFTSDMNELAARHMVMESHLHHAIEKHELLLNYQPLMDIESNEVVGAEALLRWSNRKFGRLLPEQFVPVTEESGLIVSIGEWVMRTACRDLANWHQLGHKQLHVSVNISSVQLRESGFLDTLKRILAQYDIDPGRINLEITESLLLKDEERNIKLLNQIADEGIKLSLDDFGTGYSSLNYLKQFPFSEVKIDRSFISDINTKKSDAALCKAIVTMAESLDLTVVGEGVEKEEQLQLLRDYQVKIAQGYYFSKPLMADSFLEFLNFWRKGHQRKYPDVDESSR